MTEKISAGMRKHIAEDLKPAARRAENEGESWEITQKILLVKIKGYPEKFLESIPVLRKWHQLRWGYTHLQVSGEEWFQEREGFFKGLGDNLDDLTEPLRIVTEILPGPSKRR